MATEVRYILFDEAELRQALSQHLVHITSGRAKPRVKRVEMLTRPPELTGCRVHFEYPGTTPPLDIDLRVVVSALLVQCRTMRVPIAARAEKRVEIAGTSVALVTTLNALRPIRRR